MQLEFSGEEYKYGQIGFKEFSDLDVHCKRWKVKGEEEQTVRNECLRASAVVSLFSWLNAQAHTLGMSFFSSVVNSAFCKRSEIFCRLLE